MDLGSTQPPIENTVPEPDRRPAQEQDVPPPANDPLASVNPTSGDKS